MKNSGLSVRFHLIQLLHMILAHNKNYRQMLYTLKKVETNIFIKKQKT